MKKFLNKSFYLIFGIVLFIALICIHCFWGEYDCLEFFIFSVGLSIMFVSGYDRLTNLRIDEIEKRISPPSGEDK